MKKKIVALCLVLALALTAVGGATLAYFTDKAEVKNTFAVGNIDIILDEAPVNADGKATDGDRVTTNSYRLYPGQTYDKDPRVTVQPNSEESYIRMFLSINNQDALDAAFGEPVALDTVLLGYDGTKWIYKGYTKENDTRTYEFWYHKTVETADDALPLEPLFTNIKIPADFDGTKMQAFNDLEINAVAHAMQAEGFATADLAWAAWTN